VAVRRRGFRRDRAHGASQRIASKDSEVEALARWHNLTTSARASRRVRLDVGEGDRACSIDVVHGELVILPICAAADVASRRRPLTYACRTPLHSAIASMTQAAESGAVIMPPLPAFYGNPATLDDLIDGTIGRILLRLGIDNELYTKWKGMR
jgi:hypothetical protein